MEKFHPGETFPITPEAERAALESLYENAKQAPELQFMPVILSRPGARLVLVGGIIRDSVLGVDSKDYDFICEGIPQDELIELLKPYGYVEYIRGRAYGVTKFRAAGIEGDPVDLTVPRRERYEQGKRASDTIVDTENVTTEEDFARRDFTMNTLGVDMANGNIVDPFGGLEDIRNRVIRCVGNPMQRFTEDPGRILRMVRFSAKYGFDIEPDTLAAAQACKGEITRLFRNDRKQLVPRVSTEKAREEIEKALLGDPVKFIELCDNTENGIDILDTYFPGLSKLKEVAQSPEYHSEGDAFTHTLLTLKNLPAEAPLSVRYAALLHDLGKLDTQNVTESGKITFYGHEKFSVERAANILTNLRVTNEYKQSVLWQIRNHMDMLSNFYNMKPNKKKKFAVHPDFHNLLILAEADSRASIRPDGSTNLKFVDAANEVLAELEKGEPQSIISGSEILEAAYRRNPDYTAGPVFNQIKTTVNKAYQDGQLADPDPANVKIKALVLMQRLINSTIPKGVEEILES